MWLLAIAPLPAMAATTSAPSSPEQVADLYLQLFVNQDVQALHQLNAYLAPAFDDQHPFDAEALTHAVAERAAQEDAQAEEAVVGLPKAEREHAKKALLAAIRSVGSTITRRQCKAISSDIRENDAARGVSGEFASDDIATVIYRCKVPSVDPQLLGVIVAGDDLPPSKTPQRQQQAISGTAGRFEEVEGRQDLYRSGKSGIWLTGATDAWLQPVMDMLP